MQTISDEFRETVLGPGNRQHGALVQVYDRTGASLLLTIDDTQRSPDNPAAISWEVSVDASADCRRALTLTIPNPDGIYSQDESNPDGWVFAENNIIYLKSGYLLSGGWDLKDTFYGLIDKAAMTNSIDGMPIITVTARSIEKKALQSKFDVTTAYTDTPSESVDYAAAVNGASATATSNLAIGDALQIGAKVYQSQAYATVLGVRKAVKGNIAAKTVSPTFSRASVAYDDQGNQAASGVPRFEAGQFGQALLVEEGTTNLLSDTDSQGFTLPINVTVTSGTKYTVSMTGTGSIALSGAGTGTVTASTPVTFTASGTTLTLTPTGSTGRVQVEAKPYCTSWQIGGTARDAESLTIPTAGVLSDRGPWTIELRAKAGFAGIQHRILLSAWAKFYLDLNGANKAQFSWTDGTQQVAVSANAIPAPTDWHFWALAWDGATVRVYVDGTLYLTAAATLPIALPATLRVGSGVGYWSDGLIDDLRISSRARTDAEILAAYQSGQPLPWDEDTTLKLDFDGALAVGPVSNIVDGSTANAGVVQYSEAGLTNLELVANIDLGASVTVNSLTPNLGYGTTCTKLRTSTDGLVWTDQPTTGISSATSVRYAELTAQAQAINDAASVIITEVAVAAGAAFPPSQVNDGDNFTFWRPSVSDLDRTLTINFGQSRTWNVAYVQIGANPIDIWGGVKFKLLNGDTGVVIADKTDQFYSGLVEIVPASAITCSSIKIQVTGSAGVIAIRTVEVYNITVNNHVTFLLTDMATQAGITNKIITTSRLYRSNLTCELGDDYLQRMKEVAEAVAWEIYGDPSGYLVARPFRYDPNTPSITYKTGEANITSLSKNPNGEGIFNWIVVRSEQPDKTIISTTKDDASGSPTSTQRLGKRVKAITDNTILTQKAADQRALLELWKNTRWKAPISLDHAVANPAHEVNDVVWVEEENTKTKAPYLLNAFRLSYTPEAFSMSLELSPVG